MDPIKYTFEKLALTERIAPIKGSALAEFLAHQPITDHGTKKFEFSNEDAEKWILFLDGASNALGQRIGVVLTYPEGKLVPTTVKLCFNYTNNIAKYEACVMGIQAAIDFKVKILEVYGDSAFVIYQLTIPLRYQQQHFC
ncbi:hypothetical protein HN51_021812 [Arachis hypogaea]